MAREPLSVDQILAIALWRLGTNVEYRTISHLFGVGISTACVTVQEICTIIVEKLATRFIVIPSGNDLKAVIDDFRVSGAPPVCWRH